MGDYALGALSMRCTTACQLTSSVIGYCALLVTCFFSMAFFCANLNAADSDLACEKILDDKETEVPESCDDEIWSIIDAKGKREKIEVAFLVTQRLFSQGYYERALDYLVRFKDYIDISDTSNDYYRWLRIKGKIYYRLVNYNESLSAFRLALDGAKRSEDLYKISVSLNDVGALHKAREEYHYALQYFSESLKIKEQLELSKEMAMTLQNIGGLYNQLDDPHSAIRFYQRAESLFVSLDTVKARADLAHLYEAMGEVVARHEGISEGIKLLEKSLDQYQALSGRERDRIRVMITLSKLLLQREDYSEALTLLEKAEVMEQDAGYSSSTLLKTLMAEALLKTSAFQPAVEYASEALELSLSRDDIIEKADAYHVLYEIQKQLGDYSLALNHLNDYLRIQEKVWQQKADRQLTKLKSEVRYQQSEKELILLKKDYQIQNLQVSRQRSLLISVMSVMLLAAVMLFIYIRGKKKEAHELQSEIRRHESKYKSLEDSQKQLQNLLESTPEPIICIDPAGYILFTNKSFDQLSAISSIKIKDQPLSKFFPVLSERVKVLDFSDDDFSLQLIKGYLFESLTSRREMDVSIYSVDLADSYMILTFSELDAANVEVKSSLVNLYQFKEISENLHKMSGSLSEMDMQQVGDLLENLGLIERKLKSLSDQSSGKQNYDDVRFELANLMCLCVETWENSTGDDKISLAEKSRIWRVSIDNGSLRTRSMDRYLNFNTMPQKPRWRQVIRTAHFVLSHCELSEGQRRKLKTQLEKTSGLMRVAA